jgi:hypothetical protein
MKPNLRSSTPEASNPGKAVNIYLDNETFAWLQRLRERWGLGGKPAAWGRVIARLREETRKKKA